MSAGNFSPSQLDEKPGYAVRSEIPIFQVRGRDAQRYLHGRLTQDIKSLRPGHCAQSLFLTPHGRIQGQCFVIANDIEYTLVSDPFPTADDEETFRKALLQFRVSDDVQLELLSTVRLVSVVGHLAASVLTRLGAEVPESFSQVSKSKIQNYDITIFRRPKWECSIFEILVAHDNISDLLQHLAPTCSLLSTDDMECVRIWSGIPQLGKDLSEKVLAPEISLDQLVSFEKGCYVGQEVIEMSVARGRPNRQLILLESNTTQSPEVVAFAPGTAITLDPDSKTAIGTVSSSCVCAARARFLGYVKSENKEAGQYYCDGHQAKRIR